MDYKFKKAIKKSARQIFNTLPIIIGVVFLISILNSLVSADVYLRFFSRNIFFDSIIGAGIGSVLAGNPITSYIFGGELLKQGVSLVAVTAFLVAWVTVGLVQFPAESILLGKKFAILRNVLSFLFSIIVAIVTVLIVKFVL